MNSSPGSRFTWGPVILIGALGVLTGCPGSLEGPLDDYPMGGAGGGGTVTGSGGSGTVIPPGTGGSVVIPPGTGGTTVTGTGGSVSGTGGQGTGGSVSGTGGQGTGGRGTAGSTTTGTGGRGTGGSTTTGTGGTTAGTGGRGTGGATTGTGGATTGTGGRGGSGTGGAGAGGTTATTWTEIYTTLLNNSAYTSNCAGAACHNPGTQKNFKLATKATGYTSARALVTPGSPTAGTLYRVLNSGSMPETRPKMPAADLAKIQSWISAGALDN